MTDSIVSSVVHPLLRDAAAWRLAALLLERPRPAWSDEIERLAGEVDDGELREAARLAPRATEGLYFDSLGPTGRASPREVSHAGMRDPGQLLAEVEAYYDAFAFRPRVEDPLDHIAVEAGFIGFLRLKEAFARARGDDAAGEVSAAAARDFIAAHVAPVAASLARALEVGGARYLWLAAHALTRRAGPAPSQTSSRVMAWLQVEEDNCACGETGQPT